MTDHDLRVLIRDEDGPHPLVREAVRPTLRYPCDPRYAMLEARPVDEDGSRILEMSWIGAPDAMLPVTQQTLTELGYGYVPQVIDCVPWRLVNAGRDPLRGLEYYVREEEPDVAA